MVRSRILDCERVKFFGINYKKLILLLSHLAVISIDIVKLNFTHARVIKGNGFVSYVKRITQFLN